MPNSFINIPVTVSCFSFAIVIPEICASLIEIVVLSRRLDESGKIKQDISFAEVEELAPFELIFCAHDDSKRTMLIDTKQIVRNRFVDMLGCKIYNCFISALFHHFYGLY